MSESFDMPEFNFDEAEKSFLEIEFNDEVIKIEDKSATLYAAGLSLVNARAARDLQKAEMQEREDAVKDLTKEIEDYKTEMKLVLDALTVKRADIEAELWDDRKKMRMLAEEVYRAERLLRQALENEQTKKLYQSNSLRFDEITADLHWRKFAFKHQIEGAKLLATAKRSICGDKMGLGKSLTSLIYLDMLESQRALYIVPDDTVSNMVNEISRWAPHREILQLGKLSKGERDLMIKVTTFMQSYVVVVNYSAWRKDKSLLKSLTGMRFDTCVIDEAHMIKETTTAAYKGVKTIIMAENSCPDCGMPVESIHLPFVPEDYRLRQDFIACTSTSCSWSTNMDRSNDVNRDAYEMCSIKNVLPMTGTVILNKPTDLFSLLSLIDPVNFHEKYVFERDYCAQDYYNNNRIIFKPGGLDALISKLSGKYIARDRKSAGIVLPEQEIINYELVLDPDQYPDQYRVIKQLSERAAIMLNSGKKMNILATIALITRKRQANVWPAGITMKDDEGNVVFSVGDDVRESIKLDKCIDPTGAGLIPDVTAEGNMELGERVAVFSQFKGPLIELERRLKAANISVVRFDGDTPDHVKNQVKLDFDVTTCGDSPKWQVVLANYKTGGMGLNFTGVTQMILLDLEWNAGKNDQALGRIDRLGQTKETCVHVLHIDKSIDTWMQALMNNKRAMVEGFENTAVLSDLLRDALGDGDIL